MLNALPSIGTARVHMAAHCSPASISAESRSQAPKRRGDSYGSDSTAVLHRTLRALAIATALLPTAAWGQTCGEQVAAPPGSKDGISLAQLGTHGQVIWWRDNRDFSGGRQYISFLDSLGVPGRGWPNNGLLVSASGRSPLPSILKEISPEAVVGVWADFRDTTGYDTRVAFLTTPIGAEVAPSGVTTDTITFRAGNQFPVGIVAQDDSHALVVMQDVRGTSRTLIKQVALPGATLGAWPAEGVTLEDAAGEFPAGLAPVAGCTDDSSGCFVLTAGTTPLDPFHYQITFRLHRLLPDGSSDPRWPSSGLTLTQDGDEFNQINPLLPDGAGGAYLAWTTGNHSSQGLGRIMLQHIDRDGGVHENWGALGKEAMPSVTTAYQWLPRMATSALGEVALLVETDSRTLRLRCFLPDGTSNTNWPDSGLALGDISGASTLVSGSASLITSGSRLVAVWSALPVGVSGTHSTLGAVFGLDGTVEPAWSVQGRTLCSSGGNDRLQALGFDSTQRFALAWLIGTDDLRFARFSIQDGVVPVHAVARLLGHSLRHGYLTSAWAFSGVSTVHPIGLFRRNGALARRGIVEQVGREIYSLSDSIPAGSGTVEYMLGVEAGNGFEVISDALSVPLAEAQPGLTIRVLSSSSRRRFALELSVGSLAQSIDLCAFDLCGRIVGKRTITRLAPGSHQLELTAPSARTGVYFVRATWRESVATARGIMLE